MILSRLVVKKWGIFFWKKFPFVFFLFFPAINYQISISWSSVFSAMMLFSSSRNNLEKNGGEKIFGFPACIFFILCSLYLCETMRFNFVPIRPIQLFSFSGVARPSI